MLVKCGIAGSGIIVLVVAALLFRVVVSLAWLDNAVGLKRAASEGRLPWNASILR
jgi:hypothetical protein